MGMYSITVLIQYYDLSKYKENIVGYLAEFLRRARELIRLYSMTLGPQVRTVQYNGMVQYVQVLYHTQVKTT